MYVPHVFGYNVTVLYMIYVATRFFAGTVAAKIYDSHNFGQPMHFMPVLHFKTKLCEHFCIRMMLKFDRRRLSHCINAIERRHHTIRSIFLRLKYVQPTVSDALHAICAIRISNDVSRVDGKGIYQATCYQSETHTCR